MKRIEVDGHVHSKNDLEEIKQEVITWRDKSMDQWPEAIPFTTGATHVIGILSGVIEQYPEDEGDPMEQVVLVVTFNGEDGPITSAIGPFKDFEDAMTMRADLFEKELITSSYPLQMRLPERWRKWRSTE